LEGITLPGSEDREIALEDLSPKSLTAYDSDGLKLTSIIENNAETLQVKVTTNSSKITFRGNIRVNSKLEYILPTKTEASVIRVWESDRDGKKIKDISSESYEITTDNVSEPSSIILNESEYWDYRTIVVEYPKEEQPLLGFQVSFEPILESLKIKWNGQACPEFSEQKIQIDPLKPNIIWALCPSLPASDDLEVSISYKYQGDKNRFQISEIDPSEEGLWEVYVNDDKTGEYTIDENAIVFNNPLPEAAKVRIRYSTPQ
jgi:hypothetical protein